MFRFTLGLLLGMSITVAYAQWYPGMSQDQRDMATERNWNQQRWDDQRRDQEHFQDSFDRRKPC